MQLVNHISNPGQVFQNFSRTAAICLKHGVIQLDKQGWLKFLESFLCTLQHAGFRTLDIDFDQGHQWPFALSHERVDGDDINRNSLRIEAMVSRMIGVDGEVHDSRAFGDCTAESFDL